MTAKQSAHYPAHPANHPRLTIIREDLTPQALAALYSSHDIFLQTARGVGFSLPVLEALACGMKVVSTPLPPIVEFQSNRIFFGSGGKWEPTMHHIYTDCWPIWYEPDVESLARAVKSATRNYSAEHRNGFNIEDYSWNTVAKLLMAQIEELR